MRHQQAQTQPRRRHTVRQTRGPLRGHRAHRSDQRVATPLKQALGVSGIGAVLQRWPTAIAVIAVGGGLFLLGYGVLAAWRAFRPSVMIIGEDRTPLRKAVLACVAFTWLNPHVYLDTVLLLGSVAVAHGDGRWLFGLGAAIASAVWFSALGFGAKRLAGLFAKPMAWRVLDVVIAVTMAGLGTALLLGRV
ncbi:LysE/ArgO family amino acid transporter [Amycolatopsis sp. lyj-23]|uniref:LysE/ArgO family amino acid transporter n=1 Tax=Amycolatopsis sp. lyj-23 TaxID=2789283 RepID=UPI00397AE9E7